MGFRGDQYSSFERTRDFHSVSIGPASLSECPEDSGWGFTNIDNNDADGVVLKFTIVWH